MALGEKITRLRKEHQLSQEAFAEQFNVTRQTVSNWENEKSSPDLEMIINISETFNISVDELLKDTPPAERIPDPTIRPKNKAWLLAFLVVALIVFLTFITLNKGKVVNYQLQDERTVTLNKTDTETSIATGHFSIAKDGIATLKIAGTSDSGNLTVRIIHNGTKETVYQKTSDNFSEQQRLTLTKGTYNIQITANEVQEQVLSVTYDVSVKGS